ncbi:MAG: major capsid protein [Clostridia bacterium]|nr:major capsid protein [Clostridia bacterium]
MNMTKTNRLYRLEYELKYQNGTITIPTMSNRGAPANQKIMDTVVSSFLFKIPHYKMEDGLIADDFRERIPFQGTTEDLVLVEQVMAEKFELAQIQWEDLWEYNFCMAVRGYVMNGLNNTVLDLYDKFGVKRKTITIDFGTNNDNNVYHEILDAVLYQRVSAGYNHNKRVAFCSPEFYEKIRTNTHVYEAHKYQDSAFLRELGLEGFNHYDVEWVLYPNGTATENSYTPWIEPGAAYLVPFGIPELFHETFGPADYMESLGKPAQNMNAKYELMPMARGLNLESQTNVIVHCTRPQCIVKLVAKEFETLERFVPKSPVTPVKRK